MPAESSSTCLPDRDSSAHLDVQGGSSQLQVLQPGGPPPPHGLQPRHGRDAAQSPPSKLLEAPSQQPDVHSALDDCCPFDPPMQVSPGCPCNGQCMTAGEA